MSQGEILTALEAKLKSHGLEVPIDWNTDKPVRFESQWFLGRKWEFAGKTYARAWFGDFSKGFKEEWKSYEKVSKEEAEAADSHSENAIKLEREEIERFHLEVAARVSIEWEQFTSTGTTPYSTRKGLAQLWGARLKENSPHDPIIIVPLRDVAGKLWNYQRIYAQKLSAGDKFFVEGARIEGCFFVLGSHDKLLSHAHPIAYVCEGYATACTVQASLGEAALVVAAFNAGNLQAVCTALKEQNPKRAIVVCADNDAYTQFQGKPYNVGLEKGRRAAGAVQGKIVYPIFKHPQKGLTDFNDLQAAEGLERVKDQIEHPENYVKGIQPMCIEYSKNGKPKLPTEKQVSEYMHEYFKDRIIKQNKSLFKFTGTHWVELQQKELDAMKIMVNVAANGLLGIRDIENYYKYFWTHCPHVPGGVDLFQPNPFVANFQNGSLFLGDTLDFRKHDPKDFLTSCLPFDKPEWSPGQELPPAPIYDAMVERLWGLSVDKKQVHELAEELIGACLCPAFPMIVIFYGKPNSGKSTLIKLLVKLVQKENVSSVQLCDFLGFNMETMVGKLVNFDTDIDVNKPINDSAVKKLIDRVPMKVRRKGLADVYAHLPALHLFAANRLPTSLDGSSHAYGRRMILVHTEAELKEQGTFDFEDRILKGELAGLLGRGLQGLYRLHANGGHYTIPEGSKERVREMEMESDVLGQFLDDIAVGEVRADNGHILRRGPGFKIDRPALWTCFKNWQDDTLPRGQGHLGKKTFFSQMETRGIVAKKDRLGNYFFDGVGVQVQSESIA